MIRNRDTLTRSPAHATALDCLEAGITAALPERAVGAAIARDGNLLHVADATFDLTDVHRVLLLAIGKAAVGASSAIFRAVDVDGGLVATDTKPAGFPASLEVVRGGHPLPDAGSVNAGARARDLLADADERTLVLAAVTGGGSALMEAPVEGLSLANLRATTRSLLDAGMSIDAVNAVRKHCSRVKGGRLARMAAPATVAVLVVSDVVGDDFATIASGPFAPDPTTYDDAVAALPNDAPGAVREHLSAGVRGERPETPAPGDAAFDRVRHAIAANGETAVDAARQAATERGHETHVLDLEVAGEAREIGARHAALARAIRARDGACGRPVVVLAGGETTVTVRGEGEGGPNAECALAAARLLPDGAVLACVDTDGRDGRSTAAGALVDANAWSEDAAEAFDRNDAAGFLRGRNALVETGATGTNVNDLHVLVVD